MASVLQTSEITDMAAWLRGRARIESEVCGDSRPNSFDEAADTLEAWAATISQCRAAGFLDENGADQSRHGRLRGQKAKVSADDVRAMRRRRAGGETYPAIAKDYDLSISQVRRACVGVSWGYIEDVAVSPRCFVKGGAR